MSARTGLEIAVVGMAGRFPGAPELPALLEVLRHGEDCIALLSDRELEAAGVPEAVRRSPDYVPVRGVLADVDRFDASFFDINPQEAAITDPQHRIFLETAWAALEDAGQVPEGRRIGVYAGTSLNSYHRHNLQPRPELEAGLGRIRMTIGADKDFLSSRVAYRLDLRGPAVTVQTACSTSLVAVCLACEGLLAGACDVALAGGASVAVPQGAGYRWEEGSIYSARGRCRAFDARADGAVPGSGVAVVVLRRLDEALAEGDPVRAVIRGFAVNNDGRRKIGFTAPGREGQRTVIESALRMAEVEPESIGYVEAHGTGTALGDPAEIAALREVFASSGARGPRCALGSIKTNLGHLDAAAGVTGLIKVVLMLEHRQLFASLHFRAPNPEIDFGPLAVCTEARDWLTDGAPRRAGVSSFGIGGTNAHVVLEEAPEPAPSEAREGWQLLVLSARGEDRLRPMRERLSRHLEDGAAPSLPDVAWTLQAGRRHFEHRTFVVARETEGAIEALRAPAAGGAPAAPPVGSVAFLFPGQGEDLAGVGRELYLDLPAFRRAFDRCSDLVASLDGPDLRGLLLHPPADAAEARARLDETEAAQPASFALSYSLALLWEGWGIPPAALLGHSVGEYVAATVAGVFSLDDAVELMVERGRLMQTLPVGAMLAVSLAAEELEPRLAADLALAAVNGPRRCTVSGPSGAVEELASELAREGVAWRRLPASRAFHSPQVEALREPFLERVRSIELRPPATPVVSTLSGTWLRPEEAAAPDYWFEQMRRPVRFDRAVSTLLELEAPALLVLGSGTGLRALVTARARTAGAPVLAPLAASRRDGEVASCLRALGELWAAGAAPAWEAVTGRGRLVSLPAYPFRRERHWIEAPSAEAAPRGGWLISSDAAGGDLARELARVLGGEAILARSHGEARAGAPDRHATGWVDPDRIEPIERRLESEVEILAVDDRPGLRAALDALSCTYVLGFLRGRGVPLRPGDSFPLEGLRETLGVEPRFARFVAFMLRVLEEDGWLRRRGERLEVPAELPPEPQPAALRADLDRRFPEERRLVEQLDRCASSYPETLTGAAEPLSVLFSADEDPWGSAASGGTAPARRSALYLRLVAEWLGERLGETSARPLRVLEVGGGRGRLLDLLSPLFAGGGLEYWFTDVGRSFLVAAERKARERRLPNLRVERLDISRDPASQGFRPGDFDLVLAYDVLHATPDVVRAVRHVRDLLAPGGAVWTIEAVREERWIDMVWGLAPGWWQFEDDGLRTGGPLLGLDGWEAVFRRAGFEGIASFPRDPLRRSASDHGLVVAQRPAAAGPAGEPYGEIRGVLFCGGDRTERGDCRGPAERALAGAEALAADLGLDPATFLVALAPAEPAARVAAAGVRPGTGLIEWQGSAEEVAARVARLLPSLTESAPCALRLLARPAPSARDPRAEGAAAGPDELEAEVRGTVAGVWRDLLGVAEISDHDGFLDLGGDSLVAVQVSARLRHIFEIELTPGDLFEAPTVATLSAVILERLGAPAGDAMAPADATSGGIDG
jgi:acyl transferase domain-containing protein/SAM-dependent methyltransferase/acyl carrier protein